MNTSHNTISIHDRGLTLGDGVFDTALVKDGQIIWEDLHIARLIRHAAAIGIMIKYDDIQADMHRALVNFSNAYGALRTTVTRGVTGRGLWPQSEMIPTLFSTVQPFDPALIGAGVTLTTTTIRRNETSPTSCLKTLNYLDAVLAAREAHTKGFDDALFLNTQGRAACTTIANIFVLKGQTLLTPPLDDGAIDGIMRHTLLKNPPQGFEARAQSLTLNDMEKADGLFLTNSLRLIRPVTRWNEINFDSSSAIIPLNEHIFSLEL
jgi:branched-chain amino acid aminotransferase